MSSAALAMAARRPLLDYNFMNPGQLPPGFIYSNASGLRTYYNSSGNLVTAAANEAIWEYDPVTLALLGMRWEMLSRQNYIPNSEFTNGVTDAPIRGGSLAAVALPNWLGRFTTGLSFGAGVTTYAGAGTSLANTGMTFSAFVKMDDGLAPNIPSSTPTSALNDFVIVIGGSVPATHSMQYVGNGIYRVYTARTTSTTLLGNNGIVKYDTNSGRTFKVTGYQLEISGNVSMTSYIPTTGGTASRLSDVANASSLSPWFNPVEGSLLFDGSIAFTPSTYFGIGHFSDGTSGNRIVMAINNLLRFQSLVNVGGVPQAFLTCPGTVVVGSRFLASFSYKANNIIGSYDGNDIAADSNALLPTVNSFRLGTTTGASEGFMGHVQRLLYYPRSFSAAEIKRMAT